MKRTIGWTELILGVLLLVLGIYTFASPASALIGMALLYGILAVVTGIADIILYVRLERKIGFGPTLSLVGGIFSVIAGIIILINPNVGGFAIAALFSIWFIAHCVSRLANLWITRLIAGRAQYYFSLVINILGIILGVILLLNPGLSALYAAYLIGFYLILLGIGSVVMAFGRTDK